MPLPDPVPQPASAAGHSRPGAPVASLTEGQGAGGNGADGELESLPPEFVNIQPGGGRVMSLELAWGCVRRAYLRTFRRGYLRRMEACRQGERNPAPHPVLDPRDAKFYENQPGGWRWDADDDPFTWRDHLGFARWGLAELIVFSLMWFGPLALWACIYPWREGFDLSEYWDGGATWDSIWFWFGVVSLVPGALCVWFFRDPPRTIPDESGAVVSPADGTIAEVAKLDFHPFVDGPAVRIGIFLSIFNVHINRWPQAGRVIGIDYHPGKYLDARDPNSVTENEQAHIRFETTDPADGFVNGKGRRMVIHAIAGAVARRIVCILKPGDEKPRGAKIGMIKLGSRTELLMPDEPGLMVRVKIGQKVLGGKTVLAAYVLDETLPGEATATFASLPAATAATGSAATGSAATGSAATGSAAVADDVPTPAVDR